MDKTRQTYINVTKDLIRDGQWQIDEREASIQ